MSNITLASPYLTVNDFKNAFESQMIDYKAKSISSLSVLEVCLLASVKQQLAKENHTFNFEMIYDEYRNFTSRISTFGRHTGGSLYFVKPVALKAFERLLELELLKYVDGSKTGAKEYRMIKSKMGREEIFAAIVDYGVGIPEPVLKW